MRYMFRIITNVNLSAEEREKYMHLEMSILHPFFLRPGEVEEPYSDFLISQAR